MGQDHLCGKYHLSFWPVGDCDKKGNEMTKRELINSLENIHDDEVIVCADDTGGWDNIMAVGRLDGLPAIFFGSGSPFSDE